MSLINSLLPSLFIQPQLLKVSRLLIPPRVPEFSNGNELIEAIRQKRATLMFGNSDSLIWEQITNSDSKVMKSFHEALKVHFDRYSYSQSQTDAG